MTPAKTNESIHVGRGLAGPVLSWLVVAAAIYAVVGISWWLYPLAVFVIANRQLAFFNYGHGGVHGTFLPNKPVGDFVARYFVLFPNWSQLSRYRMKHLLHHRLLGTELDPDLGLYASYPHGAGWWRALMLRWVSGRMVWDFLDYYTDIPRLARRERNLQRKGSVFGATDWPQFLIFQIVVIGALAYFGWWREYLLFWIVPALVFLPYNYFVGGLQHGVVVRDADESRRSRTISGPKWLMEILLPADINFHGVHHLYPHVPHYRLRAKDQELADRHARESYGSAVRALWSKE